MRASSVVGILMLSVAGSALLVGYAVPTRRLGVDVESGPCVDAESRATVSRDERGYRVDVVAPADRQGAVLVLARLRRGTLMLWVTRTDDATCQRSLVVRPRLVGEPIRTVVVETRDGIVARGGLRASLPSAHRRASPRGAEAEPLQAALRSDGGPAGP